MAIEFRLLVLKDSIHFEAATSLTDRVSGSTKVSLANSQSRSSPVNRIDWFHRLTCKSWHGWSRLRKGTGRKSFDRTTYQKLGGIKSLLERFLQRVLEARETEARRQAAVKVLLALVDLESNIRAGVLTLTDLQRKLSGSLAAEDAKEAVQWLSRGDIRLVTPRPQGNEQGYELTHEHIIPALRRLAGKTLSDADKANQLLERRVNEWMGNQRSSRYLLIWRELRLIQKQEPYLVWGTKRPQKEALIAKSQWRQNSWLVAVVFVAIFGTFLTALYYSDRGQIWLMERDLWLLAQKTRNADLLQKSALAFVARKQFEDARDVVDRIQNPQSKAEALQALAEAALKVGRAEQAEVWLVAAREAAAGIEDSRDKAWTLRALAEVALKVDRASRRWRCWKACEKPQPGLKVPGIKPVPYRRWPRWPPKLKAGGWPVELHI